VTAPRPTDKRPAFLLYHRRALVSPQALDYGYHHPFLKTYRRTFTQRGSLRCRSLYLSRAGANTDILRAPIRTPAEEQARGNMQKRLDACDKTHPGMNA